MAEDYRFCLNFKGNSEENIKAGEFLKALGHKKSKIIVMAVNEFRTNHPEFFLPGRISIQSKQEVNEEIIRNLIREEIAKQVNKLYTENSSSLPVAEESDLLDDSFADTVSESVSAMLTNLDMFQ